ncbi:hypothetical protein [Streptomyces sp. MZ04]|nr:hypothetical protein [Streptomyces sp. MZ04]
MTDRTLPWYAVVATALWQALAALGDVWMPPPVPLDDHPQDFGGRDTR